MAIGLPQIIINFIKSAATAIARSAKGIVLIVIKDETDATFSIKEYNYASEAALDQAKYTASNYQQISDAFLGTPNKVYVVRIALLGTFADAVATIDTLKFNWICLADGTAADQQALATYVKGKNAVNKVRKIKAVTYDATVTDDMHIVNFTNATITRIGGSALAGWNYVGRIAGTLAGLPFTRSITYYVFADLEHVAELADMNAAIGAGEFILMNDYGEVKCARGVNSLVTVGANLTEDMKKITIVEAMDQILEDIATEFKNNYVGKYKNKYDNQALFISAVNGYFKALANEDVLDDEYTNEALIDVEAQRQAWLTSGKGEAADWDEVTVKNNTFGSYMYLAGNVKILDAIEDLTFNVNMA